MSLTLLAWAAWPALAELRDSLRHSSARSPAFGSQDTIRLLRLLEVVHLVPGRNARWLAPRSARRAEKRRSVDCRAPIYAVVRPVAEDLPSSRLVSEATIQEGLPVLSIAVSGCRLRRLTRSPLSRGRDWEEPAFVSYYESGRLRFASAAGLRFHGGVSTRTSRRRSYRLVFGSVYGQPRFLRGVVTDGSLEGPVELVVHNDRRQKGRGTAFSFVNPLAYDIARRLGGIVPENKPIRLVFNGHLENAYVLGERINDGFLRRRFGHADFDFVRGRQPLSRRETELMREGLERVAAIPTMTIEAAERIVDLDNLTQWFVAVFYTGTRDAHQAAQLRDRRDPEGRWFWVHWDLDWAFRTHGDIVLDGVWRGGESPKLSRRMLFRLFDESAEYRALFIHRVVEALNHRLDSEFVDERLEYYRAQALEQGLEDLNFLSRMETFLDARPAVVRRQMQQRLEAGAEVSVRVDGDGPLRVDGFEVETPWQGIYFVGMAIELEAIVGSGFMYWQIGERRVEGSELKLDLEDDLEIVAVFDS